ncbi:apolipoprotein D and lipocalin family protein [Variovorax sp. HW608]|uniref:lipocalin family protein n=1 Tax=Variovorax sp. HW608 TaxID=1034889 RepID=UPI0008202473|nr:lipocalin family protein [Variovorax sp. HW608]SCK44293.1 apolipoprotein D and lipocalin family protein [Variovorax sp. HW608]
MGLRTRRAPPPAAAFDDRAMSASIGTLATAFCVGSALTLLALSTARTARNGAVPGPADGAPLMRAPLQVVAPVDLRRYAGLWHEQARLPNRSERRCAGPVTAEYTVTDDGSVRVRNRCILDDGRLDESVGTARVVEVPGQPGAGRLEVRFAPDWLAWLPAVWGDYWILKLDRDYQVALVGTPDRRCLWVLSRAPVLDVAMLHAELDYARTLGFDVDKVELTGK